MNLSTPISSVIPTSHGRVLSVLAHTDTPLSGRRIAFLLSGAVSQKQVNNVLNELSSSGLVHRTEHPPAHVYLLNRDHVAAEAIEMLADLRNRTIDRIRGAVETWDPRPGAVWLFGSFAQGSGDNQSDIDILVVRPPNQATWGDVTRTAWLNQVDDLRQAIHLWTGNDSSILDFEPEEFRTAADTGERLVDEVAHFGIHLFGDPLPARQRVRT